MTSAGWSARCASLGLAEAFRAVGSTTLPIFRAGCADHVMFYAPGCLCVTAPPDADRLERAIVAAGVGGTQWSEPDMQEWAARLRGHAERAERRFAAMLDEPFVPECLTLYLHNDCNLACSYCYAATSATDSERLDPETIAAAAQCVAQACARQGLPFHAAFHGGGEPALYRDQVATVLAVLRRTAQNAGVALFAYIATNGVMPAAEAMWLAHNFNLIGLSCDGPPDIQNLQRPQRDGSPTSQSVERTARILRQEEARFHVRTTVTRDTLQRQPDIAEYLCARLSPDALRFEPVYRCGRAAGDTTLHAEHADPFVEAYLQAEEIAARYGTPLSLSGTRPGSLHGPYCNVFRAVLNLVPGGVATACFRVGTRNAVEAGGLVIGGMNRRNGEFEIDSRRIAELRQRLLCLPAPCSTCFNRYHCVRDCPDHCALGPTPGHDATHDAQDGGAHSGAGFRCRVQKTLAYVQLRRAAGVLWQQLQTERTSERGDVSGHEPRVAVCGTTQL